ncbi:MAG: ATP-binding protein [Clostridiales bacterium]|nr:ATP-binding protein [Clostridiales bacterium]
MEKELRAALRGVSAYQNITAAPLMALSAAMLDALISGDGLAALERYTALFYSLRSAGYTDLRGWLWDALRYEDAPYPAALERDQADPALEAAARRDVETFSRLAGMDGARLIDRLAALLPGEYAAVVAGLPRWTAGAPLSFDALKAHYGAHGAGLFARYRAFLWKGGALISVPDPDYVSQTDLVGYEWQRAEVINNTRMLMEGKLVNNILLYGDSGTGKSATVKALLAVPDLEALRLIEVEKEGLAALPALIRTLGGRRQKFVLFIDDLAFDQDDQTYSALKTILEGGLEKRPVNVAIYATSNRRNLVRQTFSDREGDEVDAVETIHEKTSLAERFGLRIPYLSMNKQEFLAAVDQMADRHGIDMPRSRLHAEALKWEMHHHGRTPRVARQFILSLDV